MVLPHEPRESGGSIVSPREQTNRRDIRQGQTPGLLEEGTQQHIRELKLTPLSTSRDGLLSQPIWNNPTYPGPKLQPTWIMLWNRLECNTIHNVFRDYGATTPYTREECAEYLRNNDTYNHVQGDFIPREKFLESWDTIVTHAKTIVATPQNTDSNKKTRRPDEKPESKPTRENRLPRYAIRITQDGEYYARIKGELNGSTWNSHT